MADLLTNAGAVFSADRSRRIALWRTWGDGPKLSMVMMNPSTADETENDPTVERCERRARALGFAGLRVCNIMDVIETDSRKLDAMPSRSLCSNENRFELLTAINCARDWGDIMLCAWGKPGQKYGPVDWFCDQAAQRGVELHCLGKNKDGSPKHPLYVGYDQPLLRFRRGGLFAGQEKP